MVEHLDETALNIYTDGSSLSSPRVGGVGYTLIAVDDAGDDVIYDDYLPSVKGATNNQMELAACIAALETVTSKRPPADLPGVFALSRFSKIVIRTDSMYVCDNFPNAKWTWPTNGWRTKDGPPVQNMDYWKDLIRLVKKASPLRVDIKWVKGHKKDAHNIRADRLSRRSSSSPSTRAAGPQRVRRKLSPYALDVGSVGMEGQLMTVRIITDKYLGPPHRCHRYMYEVMDVDSPYFQRVDYIWSDVMLGAGHTYFVRVNDNSRYPQIEESFGEATEEDAPK